MVHTCSDCNGRIPFDSLHSCSHGNLRAPLLLAIHDELVRIRVAVEQQAGIAPGAWAPAAAAETKENATDKKARGRERR